MSQSSTSRSPEAAAPLHCAKCFQWNARDAEVCAACGARLWIDCQRCQHRNPRTASRCVRCGSGLHGFRAIRRVRRWMRKRRRLFIRMALVALALLLIAGAMVMLNRFMALSFRPGVVAP